MTQAFLQAVCITSVLSLLLLLPWSVKGLQYNSHKFSLWSQNFKCDFNLRILILFNFQLSFAAYSGLSV